VWSCTVGMQLCCYFVGMGRRCHLPRQGLCCSALPGGCCSTSAAHRSQGLHKQGCTAGALHGWLLVYIRTSVPWCCWKAVIECACWWVEHHIRRSRVSMCFLGPSPGPASPWPPPPPGPDEASKWASKQGHQHAYH
jgi:hypothetical protein